jgi:hypothetical protein
MNLVLDSIQYAEGSTDEVSLLFVWFDHLFADLLHTFELIIRATCFQKLQQKTEIIFELNHQNLQT